MSKNQPGPEAKRKFFLDSVSDERMAGSGDSGRDPLSYTNRTANPLLTVFAGGRDRIRTCDPALIKRML